MGTTTGDKPWKIDLHKFRVYLEKKYNVTEAYYFLGYVQEINQELYSEIQKAGFILVFRQHNTAMIGKKKGNVDLEMVIIRYWWISWLKKIGLKKFCFQI